MVDARKTKAFRKLTPGKKIYVPFGKRVRVPKEVYPDALRYDGDPKLYGNRTGAKYPTGIVPEITPVKVKEFIKPDRKWTNLAPCYAPPCDAKMVDSGVAEAYLTGAIPKQTIYSYVVPERHKCRLWKFGHAAGSLVFSSSFWPIAKWSILVDGQGIYPYGADFKGQLGRTFDPVEIFHIAEQGDEIEIVCDKTGYGGDFFVQVRLMMWLWTI